MFLSETDELPKDLPDGEGVFCLRDANGKTLFIGAAGNLRAALGKIFWREKTSEKVFAKYISSLEIFEPADIDLVKIYSRAVRRLKPVYNFSIAGETLYPYLKITTEDYPQLLATRKIDDDGAEYFGAFLSSTGVRFWLELLNRVFRYRTCQIEIDGNFPAPCTQFYVKRCVAPCVASLCKRSDYLERIELIRLFLQNEREKLRRFINEKIEKAAENLEFERAAGWRDILQAVSEVFAEKDLQLWLNDAVDTFEIEERASGGILIYAVTQRGRKTLGKKVFAFENPHRLKAAEILSDTLWQFYEFHAPREIRLPFDFPGRKLLETVLSRREKRQVKISIVKKDQTKITSRRALKRARFDFDFSQIKPAVSPEKIAAEMMNFFGLKRPARKIEAFDAAHISGSDFTVAKVVWEKGKFVSEENEFWLSDETSEPETLGKAVAERFSLTQASVPDLLLIDGGRTQLQAVLKALSILKNREFQVIAAVKPPQRHGEVSHFITESGEIVKFLADSEAMRVLLRLRDEAHELSNRVHRQRRENAHFYELAKMLPSLNEAERRLLLQKFGSLRKLEKAGKEELEKFLPAGKAKNAVGDLKFFQEKTAENIKPLIVPIRYDDPNGEAKDLQPLVYRIKKKNF